MAKVPFTLRIEEDLLKQIKRDALEHGLSFSDEIETRIIESMALEYYQNIILSQNNNDIEIKNNLTNNLMSSVNHIRRVFNIW